METFNLFQYYQKVLLCNKASTQREAGCMYSDIMGESRKLKASEIGAGDLKVGTN